MLYEVSDLKKISDQKTIINIQSLELEHGKIYALLGPNGAGKTTLLNILGFLEPPTSGVIHYKTRKVRQQESELQRLRREVVMVDQHPILFTTTVYRNVEFGLKVRGVAKKERDRVIHEVLELVGMIRFINEPADLLSGGETQRVALARALAVSPEVFLCDEPTSSVDVENQKIVINILRQINKERNITVLFTTHDRAHAVDLANSTLVLNYGSLVSAGHENLFSPSLIFQKGGKRICRIEKSFELELPPEAGLDDFKDKRIFIDPKRIILCGVSEIKKEQKTYRGRVIQLSEENGNIRIVVEAGIQITIILSRNDYDKMSPGIGKHIDFIIEPESVRMF